MDVPFKIKLTSDNIFFNRRNYMPSIKQLQHRLLIKKNSLNKINLDMSNAKNSKYNMVLRKLNQEKGALFRDIKNLERQLIAQKQVLKEKKH